jgi:hypothetical protein
LQVFNTKNNNYLVVVVGVSEQLRKKVSVHNSE